MAFWLRSKREFRIQINLIPDKLAADTCLCSEGEASSLGAEGEDFESVRRKF
jgi:hypothetical protein